MNGYASELYVHTADKTLTIGANIVDNPGGAVGLTVTGQSGEVTLAGSNTYSGPTVVNRARIVVGTTSALPVGADVQLSGGQLEINLTGNLPLQLGDVTIRDSGLIRRQSSSAPPIEASSLMIDSGTIDAELFGEGTLIKTGEGTAVLAVDSQDYFGLVDVQQGKLRVNQDHALGIAPPDEEHSVFVREHGVLVNGSNVTIQGRRIVLDGGLFEGTVRGGATGSIEVRSPSIVRGSREFAISGNITGSGDLVLDGPFFFDSTSEALQITGSLNGFLGDLFVTGGAVRIAGNNSNFGEKRTRIRTRAHIFGSECAGQRCGTR